MGDIIQLNQAEIKGQLKDLVRSMVEAKGTAQQLDSEYRDIWRYFSDAGQRVAQERAAN